MRNNNNLSTVTKNLITFYCISKRIISFEEKMKKRTEEKYVCVKRKKNTHCLRFSHTTKIVTIRRNSTEITYIHVCFVYLLLCAILIPLPEKTPKKIKTN